MPHFKSFAITHHTGRNSISKKLTLIKKRRVVIGRRAACLDPDSKVKGGRSSGGGEFELVHPLRDRVDVRDVRALLRVRVDARVDQAAQLCPTLIGVSFYNARLLLAINDN